MSTEGEIFETGLFREEALRFKDRILTALWEVDFRHRRSKPLSNKGINSQVEEQSNVGPSNVALFLLPKCEKLNYT